MPFVRSACILFKTHLIFSRITGPFSLRKLQNSSFERYETDQGILTREKTDNVGMGSSPQVEAGTGFKLQDAVLLTECI